MSQFLWIFFYFMKIAKSSQTVFAQFQEKKLTVAITIDFDGNYYCQSFLVKVANHYFERLLFQFP